MVMIDLKKKVAGTPVKPPVTSTAMAAVAPTTSVKPPTTTAVQNPVAGQPSRTWTAGTVTPPVTAPTSTTRTNPALPNSMTSAKDMYMKGQLAPYLAPKATTSLFGVKGTESTPLPGVSNAVGITETGAENGGFTGLDKTATGGNMYLAGDPNAPSVQVYDGRSYIAYPDGRRELVDTPEENSIATELSGYEKSMKDAEAANIAQQQANRQGYDYAMQGLVGAEAVDRQAAQELQNRRGGFYSGGLDYQLGAIGSSYAQQRGQLSQDFNRTNQELNARYGAQTENIRNNISSLLTAAPGKIAEAIEAAKAKKDAAALDKSKTTGYYVPPGSEEVYNQLLVLKQQAEAPGITPEERKNLSSKADVLRGQLTAMGIDVSKLGASSNLSTAATSPFGIRTEEGKQFDTKAAEEKRQFNETMAFDKAQAKIKNEQWRKEFVEDTRQFDLGYALDKLKEKNNKDYNDAMTAIRDDENSLAWYKENYDQTHADEESGNNYDGLTPNQIVDNVRSNYTVQDPDTKKNRITADPELREQMFLDVIDGTEGMSDTQVNQILKMLGLTKKEIEKFTENQSVGE